MNTGKKRSKQDIINILLGLDIIVNIFPELTTTKKRKDKSINVLEFVWCFFFFLSYLLWIVILTDKICTFAMEMENHFFTD